MGTEVAPADRPSVGLVLSGGGARGAYEIGVIRYVRERIKRDSRFDVITGSSVGAINGGYIAATCDRPKAQARVLQRVWLEELSIDRVYRFGWRQLRQLPATLFGRGASRGAGEANFGGLVDARYLEEIVRTRIPWHRIGENLRAGHLQGFACIATEIATGLSTVFAQSAAGSIDPAWPAVLNELVLAVEITADHALASAAIPALFPPVRVQGRLYVDGSLRTNTPLRPAMRLGAQRLLVIGLRHEESPIARRSRLRASVAKGYPNVFFLLGKVLNALMLDKVEAEMDRVQRMNELIVAGTEAFGLDFAERLGEAMGRAPYREVQTVFVRPSEDLGRIAWESVKRTKLSRHDGLVARWIRRSIEAEERFETQESDLASYVLFDPEYVSRAIELGYHDAEAMHDQLVDLFD